MGGIDWRDIYTAPLNVDVRYVFETLVINLFYTKTPKYLSADQFIESTFSSKDSTLVEKEIYQ